MRQQALRQFARKRLVPVLTVAAAFALTPFIPTLRTNAPFFLFLGAVLISTWTGGWSSGLLATIFAALLTAWHGRETGHSVFVANSIDLLRWSLFLLVALAISSLHASRAEAEQRLRYSEQRLTLALDSAHIGIWDYNLRTRSFWWSKTLEAIYGRTDGDFPSTYGQFFGTIHFDDQPLFNRAITRTIDEGTDYDIEFRIVLPDRSIRWVNTRGRVLFNQSARAERIVGVTTDVTKRRLATERAARLANRAKGDDPPQEEAPQVHARLR